MHTGGFSYLVLLILIAIIGIISTSSIQVGSIVQRRAAEEELLHIGAQFRNALISYGNASQAGTGRTPHSLQDLLKDPRYPNPVRHLRQIYMDPLTGTNEWGIVPSADGKGIIGVYSLSKAKPIKIGEFAPGQEKFSEALTYSDWQFLGSAQDGGARLAPPPVR